MNTFVAIEAIHWCLNESYLANSSDAPEVYKRVTQVSLYYRMVRHRNDWKGLKGPAKISCI